jgi:hypothetical protein
MMESAGTKSRKIFFALPLKKGRIKAPIKKKIAG